MMRKERGKEKVIFRIYQAKGVYYLSFLIPTLITLVLLISYSFSNRGIRPDFFTLLFLTFLLVLGFSTYKTVIRPRPIILGTASGICLNVIPFRRGYFVPWVDVSQVESDHVVHRYNRYDALFKFSPPIRISGKLQDDALLKISFMPVREKKQPSVLKNVIMYDKDAMWFRVSGKISDHINTIKEIRDRYR